jgi:Domain of unknown function (DUF6504)
MLGIHDEPVDVLRRGDAPEQFLLRGRLYVVRGVLAHWVEPSGWRWAAPVWSAPADEAVCVGAAVGPAAGLGPAVGAPAVLPRRQPAGRAVVADVADRELWRVAAAAGQNAPMQVFDLCCSHEESRWTVTRLEESEQT